MCLSTVYRNEKTPAAILMRNVTQVRCLEGRVVLTDLMDNELTIEGWLEEANLVDGFVIIRSN
jgi:predicted RNA-binding protein